MSVHVLFSIVAGLLLLRIGFLWGVSSAEKWVNKVLSGVDNE